MTEPPAHDPDAAEEFAESVPIDPSPDEVRHYQELLGEVPREDVAPDDVPPDDVPAVPARDVRPPPT